MCKSIKAILAGLACFITIFVSFQIVSVNAIPRVNIMGNEVQAEVIIGTIDDSIDMLITISIGIFAFVGFLFHEFKNSEGEVKRFLIYSFLVTIMLTSASVAIGYLARVETTSLMLNQAQQLGHLNSIVAMQAIFLCCAFSSIVAAVFYHFWDD